jgi:hypothetical protein
VPVLALDPAGTLHALWSEDGDVLASRLTDAGGADSEWTSPQVLHDGEAGDVVQCQLVVAAAGDALALWAASHEGVGQSGCATAASDGEWSPACQGPTVEAGLVTFLHLSGTGKHASIAAWEAGGAVWTSTYEADVRAFSEPRRLATAAKVTWLELHEDEQGRVLLTWYNDLFGSNQGVTGIWTAWFQ